MDLGSPVTTNRSQVRPSSRTDASGGTGTDGRLSDGQDQLTGVSSDPCVVSMDVSGDSKLADSLNMFNVQGSHASGTTGCVIRSLPYPNSSQKSDLLAAVKQNDVSKVRALLSQFQLTLLSEKEHTPKFGTSMLRLAINRGFSECVQALLDGGADPNDQKKPFPLPLFLAIDKGDLKCIEVILAHPSTNKNMLSDSDGCSAVHQALKRFYSSSDPEINAKILQTVLDGGADPNTKWQFGDTPLHTAVKLGTCDAVKVLLAHNAINVEAKNHEGWTALQSAVYEGRTDIVSLMLESGADPNCQSDKVSTPLIIAIQQGHVDCLALLANHPKTDLNQRNGQQRVVALQVAVGLDRDESLKILLAAGADPNIKYSYGYTLLETTIIGGKNHLMVLLAYHSATNLDESSFLEDRLSPLHLALRTGNFYALKVLLRAGANRYVWDTLGRSPLDYAREICWRGDAPAIVRAAEESIRLLQDHSQLLRTWPNRPHDCVAERRSAS